MRGRVELHRGRGDRDFDAFEDPRHLVGMKLLRAGAETGTLQLPHEIFEPIVVLPRIGVLGLEMPTQLRLGLQGCSS